MVFESQMWDLNLECGIWKLKIPDSDDHVDKTRGFNQTILKMAQNSLPLDLEMFWAAMVR